MKKFIKYFLSFIILIFVIKIILIGSILISLPEIGYGYFYGENVKKNKIILVGSSNVKHNFDYDILNKTYKDYSVIGISMPISSGLYPLLHKLNKLNLKQNDLVIFTLPYSLYNEDSFLPVTNVNNIISLNLVKSSFIDFTKESTISLLNVKFSNYTKALSNKNIKFTDNTYLQFNNSFNGYPKKNDSLYYSCFTNKDDMFFINDLEGEFNPNYLIKIKEYIDENYKSKTYFRYPVLPINQFQLNSYKSTFLKNNLNFINSPQSAIMNKFFFYNRWYHLNFCGATRNTSNLINEIIPLLVEDK